MQYIFCSAYISRSLHRVTSSAACNEIYSLVLVMRVTFALICVMNCFPLGGYFCIELRSILTATYFVLQWHSIYSLIVSGHLISLITLATLGTQMEQSMWSHTVIWVVNRTSSSFLQGTMIPLLRTLFQKITVVWQETHFWIWSELCHELQMFLQEVQIGLNDALRRFFAPMFTHTHTHTCTLVMWQTFLPMVFTLFHWWKGGDNVTRNAAMCQERQGGRKPLTSKHGKWETNAFRGNFLQAVVAPCKNLTSPFTDLLQNQTKYSCVAQTHRTRYWSHVWLSKSAMAVRISGRMSQS